MRKPISLLTLIFVLLWLWACADSSSNSITILTPAVIAQSSPTPTLTIPYLPTLTPIPSPTPKGMPSRESFPPYISRPSSGYWLVKTWEVDLSFGSYLSWENNEAVKVGNPTSTQEGFFLSDITEWSSTISRPEWRFYRPGREYVYFSPRKTYKVDCGQDELKLYRVANNSLISQTRVSRIGDMGTYIFDCQTYMDWAADESVLSILSDKKEIFIWKVDGSQPQKLSRTLPKAYWPSAVRWSPDLTRLLMHTSESTIAITTLEGILISEFNTRQRSSYASWETNTIIFFVGYTGKTVYYINAATGKDLYNSTFSPGSNVTPQKSKISPNGRWVAQEWPYLWGNPPHISYVILDLNNATENILVSGLTNYVKFFDWKDDNSLFYLISRPVSDASQSDPALPYGFLSYNPLTREIKNLFPNALSAEWSPDHKWIYIQFLVRKPDSSLGIGGGLWQIENGNLKGETNLLDYVIYQYPSRGEDASLLPISWSHDSKKVIYGDINDNLMLLNTDGSVQKLASHLPTPRWRWFSWSADDKKVIAYGEHAWLIILPEK
jgi:hypothetical protein